MHICFLDIDGTLVLTGGAGQAAFAKTLAEDFNIPEIDAQVTFAGRSDRAIAMHLFRSHGVEASAENWSRFCSGYLSRLEEMLKTHNGYVLPGVGDFLRALAERGDIAIGLLTGNMREGARRKLSHYGLWDWFSFGGFGDQYLERCDIAAAALADACRHLNGRAAAGKNDHARHAGQIVVIGDTPHDIACGRSISARCVAVPTGHTSQEELQACKPDALVKTLETIEPIMTLFD
jgi:phosphoglycolate phosphatase-like HAD superfamily hydrolase